MSKYLSADFDRERGDALTITREEAIAIVEVGQEVGAPIIWNLLKWFSGKPGDPEPKMKDVRDNRDLARLIAHQKANVLRQIGKAESAQIVARKRWDNAGTCDEETQCEIIRTHRNKCERIKIDANAPDKNKIREEKLSNKLKSSLPCTSVEVQSGGSPGGVSAGLAAANAAPPRVIVREYGNGETGEVREADLLNDPVQFMMEFTGEDDPGGKDEKERTEKIARSRGNLKKRLKQLKPDAFNAVAWKFVEDEVKAENAFWNAVKKFGADNIPPDIEKAYNDFFNNGGRTFAGRLKMKALALGVDD